MNRLQKLGEFVYGEILDVGFNNYPNPYLKNPIGLDIEINQKPGWYAALVQADASSLPFKDYSFQTVIAGELVEHMENPLVFFREAHRVLDPNGTLIVSTPNASSFVIVLANWLGISLPEGHNNEYSKRVVELFAQKAGFRREKLIGLTSLFFFLGKFRHRFFVRIPLWLLPLCHKIIYIFREESL